LNIGNIRKIKESLTKAVVYSPLKTGVSILLNSTVSKIDSIHIEYLKIFLL